MKIHEATETAYKNGYEAGKRDALKCNPIENDMVREKLIDLIEKSGMVENRSRCKIIVDELLAAGVCFSPVALVIKDVTDYMLWQMQNALAMPAMIMPYNPEQESVEVIHEGESIFVDWHERLSKLEYVYNPGDDGPWYRADDVWACIDHARHKEVQK